MASSGGCRRLVGVSLAVVGVAVRGVRVVGRMRVMRRIVVRVSVRVGRVVRLMLGRMHGGLRRDGLLVHVPL